METLPLHERVDNLVRDCLYDDDQIEDNTPPDDALHGGGIMNHFVFNPTYIEENREEIKDLVETIPKEKFFLEGDGGWSFLNLAETRGGELWGEHPDMERFCALAVAAGYAKWIELPIPMPGGMPYVVFSHDPVFQGEKETSASSDK